jgi:transposase-like protein
MHVTPLESGSQSSAPEAAPERSAGAGSGAEREVPSVPQGSSVDPEVLAHARRRQFSERYKLKIVREADACGQPGEVGAMLRREGLYSSHLAAWRKQVREGALRELRGKKRGPARNGDRASAKRIVQLERENTRLRRRLKDAETIIEFQKKVSEVLEMPLRETEHGEGV